MADIPKEPNDPFGDNVIFSYTIQEAERDGILYRISQLNPEWEKKGFFSHVTWNLLREGGYLEPSEPGKPERVRGVNLIDLLNQCNQPLLKDHAAGKLDWFYSHKPEFPDGQRREVFIQLNEISRYTILLPSDY